MTNAVTYCRFSSDNQKEKSIDDQLRNCHERAEKEGWNVLADYKDTALSGKLQDRPGFIKMMKDAEAGIFDVLIIDDLSRLTRSVNATSIVEQIRYFNVRLITISDGIDSNDKTAKLAVGLKGMMNNIFLDNLRDSVHRGIKGNALEGKNTGGKSYGYQPIPVFSESELDVYGRPAVSHSDMEINQKQAKWVRKIFSWVIEKRSYKWIVNQLNKQNVPTVHGKNWTTSTICGKSSDPHSGILNNPIYIGKKYWNRTETTHNPETGKSKNKPRPESEWVLKERDDLRIIDDVTWAEVKKEQSLRYKKTEQKKMETGNKKSRTGAGPKYLLSGLLKCSTCGGNYIIASPGRYRCGNNHKSGSSICDNTNKILMTDIEKSIVSSMRDNLFQPEVILEFRSEVAKLIKEKKSDFQPTIRQLESELKSVNTSIQKLINFIISSESPPSSISDEITTLDNKKLELMREIDQQKDQISDIDPLIPKAIEKYEELINNLSTVAKNHIPPIRAKISSLLGGEITIGPKPDGSLEGSYRGSFSGLLGLDQNLKINDGTLKGAFFCVQDARYAASTGMCRSCDART